MDPTAAAPASTISGRSSTSPSLELDSSASEQMNVVSCCNPEEGTPPTDSLAADLPAVPTVPHAGPSTTG